MQYEQAKNWIITNKHKIRLQPLADYIGINQGNLSRYLQTDLPKQHHDKLIEYVNDLLKTDIYLD